MLLKVAPIRAKRRSKLADINAESDNKMIDTLNNEKIAKYLLTHDIVTLKLVLDSMSHSMLALSKMQVDEEDRA